MIDCFALLDEERRPWLEVEEVRLKFLARSSEVHPDRFHQATEEEREAAGRRYAELNEAHQTLSSHRLRLRHLIELETGDAPADIQQTPADLMDLFFSCGDLCRKVDEFLDRRGGADSPLLKVALFEESMAWSDKVQSLTERIGGHLADAENGVSSINTRWDTNRPETILELESAYRRLSYYERWISQLRARFVKLATG